MFRAGTILFNLWVLALTTKARALNLNVTAELKLFCESCCRNDQITSDCSLTVDFDKRNEFCGECGKVSQRQRLLQENGEENGLPEGQRSTGGESWLSMEIPPNPEGVQVKQFGCSDLGGGCDKCLDGSCKLFEAKAHDITGNDIPHDGRPYWVLEGDDFQVPDHMQDLDGRAMYCGMMCTKYKSDGCKAWTLDGAADPKTGVQLGRCYLKSGGWPYALHDDESVETWISGTTDISNELAEYDKHDITKSCNFRQDRDFVSGAGDITTWCSGTFCNGADMGTEDSPLEYTERSSIFSQEACCTECRDQAQACRATLGDGVNCCIGGGGNHPTLTCYSDPCTAISYHKAEGLCYLKNFDHVEVTQPELHGHAEVSRDGWAIAYVNTNPNPTPENHCSYETYGTDYQKGDIETWCEGTFCSGSIHGTDDDPLPYTEREGIKSMEECCKACQQQAKDCNEAHSDQDGSMECCIGGGGNHPTYVCYSQPCSAVSYDTKNKLCYFKNKNEASTVDREDWVTAPIAGNF